MNANPNEPEHVQSSSLFTNATTATLSRIRGSSFTGGFPGLWAQHYAELQYQEADLNQPRNATTEAHWTGFYAGPFSDYTQIISQSQGSGNIVGPALVMRAFVIETMTDLWGDIPLSEAGKGTGNLTPKYDTQAAVYDTIFASLTAAAGMMSGAGVQYGAADPIYGGGNQSALWIKLANSLHARAALRISSRNDAASVAKATTELQKAFAGAVLASNADNAFMTWPGGAVANPLCLNWQDSDCGGTRDDQRISERFVDTLLVNNDPRLPMFAEPTGASQGSSPTACDVPYRGFPNGHSSADVPNPCSTSGDNFSFSDYSRPTLSIRMHDSPSYIMTYSELLFIRAEAAERGLVPGNAGQLYIAAIRASMEQWGVAEADILAYLGRARVAYQGGAAGRQQIAYEKWVSLFNMESEAYAEYRRVNFPVLRPGPEAITTTIPTRLPYPEIENSLNADNFKASVTAQGGADITNRVWWDPS